MNHAHKHCNNHPHPSPQMTDSCRSCACGHVFEDRKQIGGKRFSGRNVMTLVITGYWSHLHRVSDIDIWRCKFGQVQNADPRHLWQFSHLVFRHNARVPNSLSTNVNTPFLQLYTQEFGHGVSAAVLGHCTRHTPLCVHLSCLLRGNLLLCKPITPLTHTLLQNGVSNIYAVTYNGVVYTQDVNTTTFCASIETPVLGQHQVWSRLWRIPVKLPVNSTQAYLRILGHCWPPVRRSKTDLM